MEYSSGCALCGEQPSQNWSGQGESDCLIKTKHCDGLRRCWRNVISAQCSESSEAIACPRPPDLEADGPSALKETQSFARPAPVSACKKHVLPQQTTLLC